MYSYKMLNKGDVKGNHYEFDPLKSTLFVRENSNSVFEFIRKFKTGFLNIESTFSRGNVWTNEQKSKFIESIILNFPIPAFYVNEKINGEWIVIDGLQRTKTLIDFLDNKFPLTKLELLKASNYTFFQDLDPALRTRIEDKKLNIQVLTASTPIPIVYEIFDRINTGGTQLSRQEIRNGIMQGKATNLLRELSNSDLFRQAVDNGISSKRMEDMEYVLRFLTFQLLEYKGGDFNNFLDEGMVFLNQMEEDKIEQLKLQFFRVMKRSFEFFGKDNFRKKNKDGKTSKILAVLFDAVSYYFSKNDDAFLDKNKKSILENYSKLTIRLAKQNLLNSSSNIAAKVNKRFELTTKTLSDFKNA